MTSAEFVEYVELFHREDKAKYEKHEKWEHYASALIAEVRRSWVTKKTMVDDKDFLLRYIIPEKKDNQTPVSKDEKEKTDLAIEKYAWGLISGKAIPKKQRKRTKKNGTHPHTSKSGRKVKS